MGRSKNKTGGNWTVVFHGRYRNRSYLAVRLKLLPSWLYWLPVFHLAASEQGATSAKKFPRRLPARPAYGQITSFNFASDNRRPHPSGQRTPCHRHPMFRALHSRSAKAPPSLGEGKADCRHQILRRARLPYATTHLLPPEPKHDPKLFVTVLSK
jgi:hypothetical protein